MDKLHITTLMLDFYGPLLTERQYEIMDLYVNCDYSLSEIAEQLDISRQGVFDNIRKARACMERYEKLFRLAQRHERNKQICNSIKKRIKARVNGTGAVIEEKDIKDIINGLDWIVNNN